MKYRFRLTGVSLLMLFSLSMPVLANSPQAVPGNPVQILQQALKAYPGRVIELEQKQRHNQTYYEVKILNPQGQIWELVYNAADGTLTRKKQKKDLEKSQSFHNIQALPLETFLQKARLGRIREVELEFKNGKIVYEVKWFNAQNQKLKGYFDAQTAQPLPWLDDDD